MCDGMAESDSDSRTLMSPAVPPGKTKGTPVFGVPFVGERERSGATN